MRRYFADIEIPIQEGSTIFLDIDGTLLGDSEQEVAPETAWEVQNLAKNNRVLLISNNKDKKRNEAIAKNLKVEYLFTSYKKPDKKILQDVPHLETHSIYVIGDKLLVDGLFAKNIGAQFIQVKRVRAKKESMRNTLFYLVDDTLSLFSRFL